MGDGWGERGESGRLMVVQGERKGFLSNNLIHHFVLLHDIFPNIFMKEGIKYKTQIR